MWRERKMEAIFLATLLTVNSVSPQIVDPCLGCKNRVNIFTFGEEVLCCVFGRECCRQSETTSVATTEGALSNRPQPRPPFSSKASFFPSFSQLSQTLFANFLQYPEDLFSSFLQFPQTLFSNFLRFPETFLSNCFQFCTTLFSNFSQLPETFFSNTLQLSQDFLSNTLQLFQNTFSNSLQISQTLSTSLANFLDIVSDISNIASSLKLPNFPKFPSNISSLLPFPFPSLASLLPFPFPSLPSLFPSSSNRSLFPLPLPTIPGFGNFFPTLAGGMLPLPTLPNLSNLFPFGNSNRSLALPTLPSLTNLIPTFPNFANIIPTPPNRTSLLPTLPNPFRVPFLLTQRTTEASNSSTTTRNPFGFLNLNNIFARPTSSDAVPPNLLGRPSTSGSSVSSDISATTSTSTNSPVPRLFPNPFQLPFLETNRGTNPPTVPVPSLPNVTLTIANSDNLTTRKPFGFFNLNNIFARPTSSDAVLSTLPNLFGKRSTSGSSVSSNISATTSTSTNSPVPRLFPNPFQFPFLETNRETNPPTVPVPSLPNVTLTIVNSDNRTTRRFRFPGLLFRNGATRTNENDAATPRRSPTIMQQEVEVPNQFSLPLLSQLRAADAKAPAKTSSNTINLLSAQDLLKEPPLDTDTSSILGPRE